MDSSLITNVTIVFVDARQTLTYTLVASRRVAPRARAPALASHRKWKSNQIQTFGRTRRRPPGGRGAAFFIFCCFCYALCDVNISDMMRCDAAARARRCLLCLDAMFGLHYICTLALEQL